MITGRSTAERLETFDLRGGGHSPARTIDRLQSASVKKYPALVAAVMLVVACGKRGSPHPPVPVIPKATTDLVVTQRGSKVILTWAYPSLTTAGQSLRDVTGVMVYRVIEVSPAAQTAPEAKPGGVESSRTGAIGPSRPRGTGDRRPGRRRPTFRDPEGVRLGRIQGIYRTDRP